MKHNNAFPLSNIELMQKYADEYWNLISPAERKEEERFEKELPEYRQRGFLSRDLCIRIARWKSCRNVKLYGLNAEESIQSATRTAFAADNDAAAIDALRQPLKGVGLRTATAILHWMKPNHYPILDFRVVKGLREPQPSSYEDLDFYHRIAERVRSVSIDTGIDLRTLDRALWAWHKQSRTRGHR
jgi:hypothetical protein